MFMSGLDRNGMSFCGGTPSNNKLLRYLGDLGWHSLTFLL